MVAIGTSSVDRLARSKRPIVERTEIHIPPAPQLSSEAVTGPTANRLSAVSRFNTDLQKWRNDAWAVEMPGQPDFALQADVATLRADTKAMIANIATNTLNITNIQTDITNLTTAITEIDNSITTIDNRITIIEGNAITGTGIVQANGANPPTAILGTPGHVPYWTSVGPPYISLTSPIYTDGTSVGIGTDLPAVLLDVGLAGTTPGVMRLAGGTSGNVTIQTAAAAGAWTFTLPVNDGSANEFLKTNGSGVTSWSSVVLTTDVSGLLPTANGGTNHGLYTAGSVIFAGAGGLLLTEDNANLFYDDAQNRFGVGTNTPSTELTVASTSASDPRGIMSAQYSTDAVGARIHFRKARGTEALPTTVVTGDVLGRVRFSGYDGANYLQMGSIDVVSRGTVGATRVPTYMAFSVATDNTPSILTETMRLLADSAGSVSVGIGTGTILTPSEKLHIHGTSVLSRIRFTNSSSGVGANDGALVGFNALDLYFYNRENGNVFLYTNDTLRMTILPAGNVGIGTSPLSRLHAAIDDAVATVTDVLRLNHSLNTGGTAANFGTGILLTGETSTTDAQDMARIQTIWTDSTHATRTSSLQFQTVNSAAALATRVWIEGNGNVGVGISPTTNFHVYSAAGNVIQFIQGPTSGQETSLLFAGSGGNWKIGQQNTLFSGSLAFCLNSLGSPLVLFSRTGNVGIGMGANVPGALLDLGLAGTTLGVMRMAGSTSGNVTIQPQAIAGTWTLQLPQNDGGANEFLRTDGAGITSWASVTPTYAFTEGSVIFAGVGGTSLAEDNANFFWDNAANALLIGNPTSINSTIAASTAAARTTSTIGYLLVEQDTSATNGISKTGLYVNATGNWTGVGAGTFVRGVVGLADGSPTENTGGAFGATGAAALSHGIWGTGSATGTQNIGVRGTASSVATTNYGGYFEASGATTNYGIYVANGTTRIAAGTATIAPLLFTSGVDLTAPIAGVMEYDGRFELTDVDAVRRHIVQAVAATKTTAGAPYANDGYVDMVINGTTIRFLTTA